MQLRLVNRMYSVLASENAENDSLCSLWHRGHCTIFRYLSHQNTVCWRIIFNSISELSSKCMSVNCLVASDCFRCLTSRLMLVRLPIGPIDWLLSVIVAISDHIHVFV